MAEETKNVKYNYDGEFISNSRGMKLFTCRWQPVNQDRKALIFMLHGYAMESSIALKDVGIRLARAGYAVYGIDYEGHGKSTGLKGYIENFDVVVNDCSEYFTRICEKEENKEKRKFLFGDSMGGAIALFLDMKRPNYWDGAVLIAPMCKLADDLVSNRFVLHTLFKLCKFFPTWKVISVEDIIETAVRDPERRAKVSFPFIIVHGEGDTITDPSGSKQLYEMACSTDKTFKLYPDMWHALTTGELPENIKLVFSDIIAWLDERAKPIYNH